MEGLDLISITLFSTGLRAKIHLLSRVLGQLGGHLILSGEDG